MAIHFFDKNSDFLAYKKKFSKKTFGLVPTMGNLHKAHLSLLKKSIKENDISILTIFVNPKQFGPHEDFQKYPRTLESDISLVADMASKMKLVKKDVVIYSPEKIEEIYPPNFNTVISISSLSNIIEGQFRPGHFDGVATVVYRLFSLFKPDRAYFGQKDYQQLLVIKTMVNDLNLDIEIKDVAIGREKSGLAMSSRNQYLSEVQKNEALILRKTILDLKAIIEKNELTKAIKKAQEIIEQNTKFNYLTIRDANTLSEVSNKTKKVIILGTYQIDKTRLLDNEVVKLK